MGKRVSEAARANARSTTAQWRRDHPERARELNKRYREKARREALTAYGGDPPVCACPGCDVSDIRFLTLDHENGDGAAARRKNPNHAGAYLACHLRKNGWPPGYRVLCWNCNVASHIYGECPHVLTPLLAVASTS